MSTVIPISTTPEVRAASRELLDAMGAGQPETAHAVQPLELEPGIYRDMGFLTYARIDAASQSRLSRLAPPSTPAHCFAYMQQPPVKTPALLLGDATHCAILEPETFENRFVTLGQCEGITAKKTRCSNSASGLYNGVALCGTHKAGPNDETLTVLSAVDYETCLRVRDAIWAHPAARMLLEKMGDRELSMLWRDEATGELCKGRIDLTVPEFDTLADLKSTRSASRDEFVRSILRYGYHRQGAMYLDGAFATSLGDFENYCFIAYEKEPPYAVAVYRLDDQSLVAGGREMEQLLALYAKCRRENHWPAYSEEVEDISIAAAVGGVFTGEMI